MKIISRNQVLKLKQKTITNDGYIEHSGETMTIGEFEKYCDDNYDILIDNVECQDKSYIKNNKDNNWYLED
jgi:hypothetical protein